MECVHVVYIQFIHWYSNQMVSVKFGDEISSIFRICNGVRQGGVLSGLLFNTYIDGILQNVSSMNVGCRLGIMNSSIIAYAGDIVLCTERRKDLEKLERWRSALEERGMRISMIFLNICLPVLLRKRGRGK